MDLGTVVCGLIGHSSIVNIDFGRISCARCGVVLADGLTQAINPEWEKTLVYRKCPHGPDCKKCDANRKQLTWKDRLLTKAG